MLIFGKSDTGIVRDVNQDFYSFSECDGNTGWAVVCDGMGGENGGNVASQTAVEIIKKQLDRSINSQTNANSIKLILTSAISAANSSVYSMSCQDEALKGMGTTVVCCVVKDKTAYVMYAGDSRLYKIGDSIQRITKDHSVVQQMVDDGIITEEEAQNHPKKRYITRALGVEPEIYCDYIEFECEDTDVILLCSDGLTNKISDNEIEDITHNTPLSELTQVLIDKSNERGGEDNITAVVLSQF